MLSRYTDHFLMHVFTPGFGLDCFQPVPPLIFSSDFLCIAERVMDSQAGSTKDQHG